MKTVRKHKKGDDKLIQGKKPESVARRRTNEKQADSRQIETLQGQIGNQALGRMLGKREEGRLESVRQAAAAVQRQSETETDAASAPSSMSVMWKHAVASPISEAHTLLAEPKRRNIKKAVANLNAVLKVVTDLYLANSQREPALASELLNFSSDVGNTISFLEPHVGVKMDIEEIRGLLDPNAPAMFTNLSLGDKL